jgi:drug/metabolite transporter (DMT)-like permease
MEPDQINSEKNGKGSGWTAVGGALLVTMIWSSSFVIVKIGLNSLGPLTIAGLRYFLGFLMLAPLLLFRKKTIRPISTTMWLRLTLIGISSYTIGNGAMFWGLKYIPATTGSLMMSLIPLLVLGGGAAFLREIPSGWQVLGVFVSLIGSGIFFSGGLESGEPLGLVIMAFGLIGFMSFSLLGRGIARNDTLDTLTLTALPLLIGGLITLMLALIVEGMPDFSGRSIFVVLWLALVNTALGYWVYNRALRKLTALKMNMIMNLAPFFTALLSWIILGEHLTGIQYFGMIIMVGGVAFVQLGKPNPRPTGNAEGSL